MSNNQKVYASLAIGTLLFIALIVGLVMWKKHKQRKRSITPNEYYSKSHYDGIDISHYQKAIDWNEIAKNKKIQFVYIKASDGEVGVDDYYRRNVNGAHHANKLVGAYHFLSSTRGVRQQFEEFRNIVKKSDIDLIPMLDVEIVYDRKTGKEKHGVLGWTNKQVQDSTMLFIQLCKQYYGVAPLIYSAQNFYNYRMSPYFDNYYLYISRYNTQRPVLKNRGKANIWQYSETGRVKGISGYVDLCRFVNGTNLSMLRMKK